MFELCSVNGGDVSVVQPCKPWLWSRNLNASYRAYQAYSRLYRAFDKMGVKTFSSVQDYLAGSGYASSKPSLGKRTLVA